MNHFSFKYRHAQDLLNYVEAGLDMEVFSYKGDDQIDGDGDPTLDIDGIARGSLEAFDTRVLFDPFEEKFDLIALDALT